MATLALTEVGTWTDTSLTGRIGRFGDAIVNWYRTSGASNTTEFDDTGAAGAFTPFSYVGGSSGDRFVGGGQGDDTHLYLGQSDGDLMRFALDGTATDIGNKTGSGGTWRYIHAGHASYISAGHTITGGTSRITFYTKPNGGTPVDIISEGFTSGVAWFEVVEVDPVTGNIFTSKNTGVARGVECYDDWGDPVWSCTLPNASDGSPYAVVGLALTSAGLIAYTNDNDQPSGSRVNNNFWLIDPADGSYEVIDATVDGTPWEDWADGTDEFANRTGTVAGLGDGIFFAATLGRVYGGSLVTPPTGGWRVGRIGFPAGGSA